MSRYPRSRRGLLAVRSTLHLAPPPKALRTTVPGDRTAPNLVSMLVHIAGAMNLGHRGIAAHLLVQVSTRSCNSKESRKQ